MENLPHLSDNLVLAYYGITDKGCVRKTNEDVWGQTDDHRFFSVADGMGGRKAGEVAAKQAVSTLCSCIEKDPSLHRENQSVPAICHCIHSAIQQANRIVYDLSKKNVQFLGMGSTVCCLYFHQKYLVYGHVGDSRIYCLRNQKLKQLTQDDSLIAELLEVGVITQAEAKNFPLKHILTKSIGTKPLVEPTVNALAFKSGDLFLLCSDGLSNTISDDIIEKLLNQDYPLDKLAQNLVDAAKQKGGYDNITVVLLKVIKE